MKYRFKFITLVCTFLPFYAHSGGDPDFVKFPEGYQQAFTQYDTANRANQTQVAKFYANDIAIASYKKGEEATPGSVVIMEIYEPKKDAAGKILPFYFPDRTSSIMMRRLTRFSLSVELVSCLTNTK